MAEPRDASSPIKNRRIGKERVEKEETFWNSKERKPKGYLALEPERFGLRNPKDGDNRGEITGIKMTPFWFLREIQGFLQTGIPCLSRKERDIRGR